MALRRGIIGITVTLGIVLMIGAPLTASAQGGRGGPPPYTPEPDAGDLKSVLFNWTWYMGMLRGIEEHELMVSLEYQGNGTIEVDGEPCTLTQYRGSTNYQTPGQRIQYTCTLLNGQTHSDIEVVSGRYAWNEDIPGAELIPGEGTATAMPDAVEERARVTHVPLHPLRWRERGYDQAQLLALAVAESLGLQHVEVLARRRDTPVQFRLPAARRRSNVRGAFAVVRPQAVEGKRLLLVDDVITTRSTVSACAEALKKAGAASVDVLAVCHTGAGFSYES